MTSDKFIEMAKHTGCTVGETASNQRSAGYSEQDIAEWRTLKDQKDDAFMVPYTDAQGNEGFRSAPRRLDQ